MKLSRLHIAYFLIAVVSLGTCVVPLLHAVSHHHEGGEHDTLMHEHPDYAAWLDASIHVVDTDLDCILCSTTELNTLSLSAITYNQFKRTHTRSNPYLFATESLIISQGIRGPPAKLV
ncbi:MAG: hypothetical protein KTR29_02765 [Rhodothermaceae bacterium]|nr:hypothetical protein [Rhodothermaceae bacterium]